MNSLVQEFCESRDQEVFEYVPERPKIEGLVDSNDIEEDSNKTVEVIGFNREKLLQMFDNDLRVTTLKTNYNEFRDKEEKTGFYINQNEGTCLREKSISERLEILNRELLVVKEEIRSTSVNEEELQLLDKTLNLQQSIYNDCEENFKNILSKFDYHKVMDNFNSENCLNSEKVEEPVSYEFYLNQTNNDSFNSKLLELKKRLDLIESTIGIGVTNNNDSRIIPIIKNLSLIKSQLQNVNVETFDVLNAKIETFLNIASGENEKKLDLNSIDTCYKVNEIYENVSELSGLIETLPKLISQLKFFYNLNSKGLEMLHSYDSLTENHKLIKNHISEQKETLDKLALSISENKDIVNENISFILEKLNKKT